MAEVRMPQLGESVTEGTITQWYKKVGDAVALDEVLFEVSTDKVDSEVPSPVAGVLTQIAAEEGATVEVGELLAVVSDGDDAPSASGADTEEATDSPETDSAESADAPAETPPPAEEAPTPPQPEGRPSPEAQAPASETPTPGTAAAPVTSPLVRGLIADHGLDASTIPATGPGGRLTRNDVERAISDGAPSSRGPARGASAAPPTPAPSTRRSGPTPAPLVRADGASSTRVPLSNIRRRTGEHMVMSRDTSPHAVTVVEVDYERVEAVRRAEGARFKEEEGFSLTYLPFIARAVIDAIEDFPHLNASVGDGELVVHHDVNLSIAVDLDFEGLLAPVVADAASKRLRAIAREIRDLADRARSKQLNLDEIQGGTFTITNAGSYGTHIVIPVINQPQVAILSTDGVQRKPVVVTDATGGESIAIHSVGLLAMSWDHRAFDGAYAAAFMARVRDILETRDWEPEL